MLDTCGVESALSKPHKSMHVTANLGTSGENNLIWSHYVGFPFSSYYIYRGTSPSNLQQLGTIQSNLNSYTDLAPPSGVVFYRVTVVKEDSCFPAKFRGVTSSGPYSQSLSNLQDYSQSPTSYLKVASQQEIIDSIQGSSVIISVFTNLSTWDAIFNQSWLTVTKSISKGTITATANTKNPEPDSRSATITLSGIGADDVIITIIQLGSSGEVGIFDAVLTNSLKI